MSVPRAPDPAKLVVSVFMKDKDLLEKIFVRLEAVTGPLDIMSKWLDFDYTDYYYKEMGQPLYRRILAFSSLIRQEDLAGIKRATNEIEADFQHQGSRQINIDPGYLLQSRFILATGKDYAHRIYIGQQIYADLTLMYTKEGFKSLAWTYPDYASPEVLAVLTRVRQKYIADLKALERNTL
jgi:hypothetical protein